MSLLRKLTDIFFLGLALLFSALIAFFATFAFWISPKAGQWMHWKFGCGWVWLMNIHVTVKGQENLPPGGGVILAPNHASMFDIPLVVSLGYPFVWIAKEQIKKIPFIGGVMKAMGSFFVKRDRSGGDLNIMKQVEDGLRQGASVVIFPEGTRTRTGDLLPFKKGAFRTAQNSGVPLIPIAIRGTFAIAKPGHWPTRGHRVSMNIGKPFHVPPGDLSPSIEEFRRILINLLSEVVE